MQEQHLVEITGQKLVDTIEHNWSLEMDGVAMYAALASRERIPERKKIFQMLSDLEQKHANSWEKRLKDLGGSVPENSSGKAHAIRVADTPGGMEEIIQAIIAEERRDVSSYLRQMRAITDSETREILREVVLDEFAHGHVLTRMLEQSSSRSVLDYLLHRKRQGTGSWIGDAVYGVNDGLGAIFGIVSGVSGATLGDSRFVLLAGLSGVVASALSMGSGAYLAAKSEREIFEAEIHREREALNQHPEAAKEEMSIFYQLKGVPEQESIRMSEYLAANPDQFLHTMAAEKLNLTEDGLSDPIKSAISGSLSTAVGAFVPIIPFFFMKGFQAVIAAAIVSLLAHFAVGAAKSLVTVRSWWSSGWEMTLIGAIEGIVTYLIGIGLGRAGA